MGLNVFASVPVPAADGVGATVSVVGQGLKTFVIGGIFVADVIIEGGIGGRFSPLLPTVDKPEQFRDVPCVIDEVRIRIVNFRSGLPVVFVGGAPITNVFGALAVPAANGTGAALDTSLFGAQKTIAAGGTFNATLTYEVSEDVNGPWAPIARIDKTSNLVNRTIVARFVRVRVTNFLSGAPTVGIGGADLHTPGGGAPEYNVTGPFVVDPAPIALGDLVQLSDAGSPFVVTLPAIVAADAGKVIVLKVVNNSIIAKTVTPAGADTIDLAATLLMNVPFMSVVLSHDGVSDWHVI